MENKYCKFCKIVKPSNEFTMGKAVCKPCRVKQQVWWNKKKKEIEIDHKKLDEKIKKEAWHEHVCECGGTYTLKCASYDKHYNSKIHRDFLETQKTINNQQ